MATQETSPLPQYYGQQLQDGTIMESPMPPRHTRESSDSRRELLRLPMQPHPAYIDENMDTVSPTPAADANPMAVSTRTSNRRLGGHPDFNDFGSPTANRYHRNSQDTRPQNPSLVHRSPYVEDYLSDEEYEPQPYRRRPSRRHRPPPSAYENDARGMSRYSAVRNRASIDAYGSSYNNDKPTTHMHYGSDDEYAPQRPPIRAAGNGGRDPPRRPPSTEDVMRLPWMIWMGSNAKNHFVAFVGEFVGTTMFLFFAFSGTQVANIGSGESDSNTTTGEATGFSPNVLLYIALVFSFSLMVNGVFIEAVLTAELVFTIFMLAKEKHKATFIAPVGIGLALFIAELVGVYYTGGSLNPARSFGPCVITGIFDKEHWIYWAGPAIGAILAVVFYKFIKMLEYEVANPGQDDDDKDAEVKEKEEEVQQVDRQGQGQV
ncbi:aquaporin-like protein [Phaeosphaeriaceae sp. SRC1lsM3a]|nr:aquaporin-like protein [Stagonospora sp. SRC1lsM3a]